MTLPRLAHAMLSAALMATVPLAFHVEAADHRTVPPLTEHQRNLVTATEIQRAFADHRPRNVILFIGDGMGDSEITSARNRRGIGKAGPCSNRQSNVAIDSSRIEPH